MSSFKYDPRRSEMSRIEIITITNGRNKSEKDMRGFLVKEFGATKNLILLIVEYTFNPKVPVEPIRKLHEWSMPGLSALIEVFL